MLYYSKIGKEKIAHFEGCPCQKAISKENLKTFKNVFAATRNGYRVCKHCNPLEKMYKENEAEVKEFCKRHVIIPSFRGHEIMLVTLDSSWKMVPISRTHVHFYHANEKLTDNPPPSPIPGYHLQKAFFPDFLSYCKYVAKHDLYRNSHPVKIKTHSSPPKKGTKRWKKREKRKEKKAKMKEIRNVLSLIGKIKKKEENKMETGTEN